MKSPVIYFSSLIILVLLCSSGFHSLSAQTKTPNLTISMSTPPFVLSTSPVRNQLNVVKTSNITATFDSDMNTSTLNTSNILVFGSQSGKHGGAVALNGVTGFTFNPTNDFKNGEVVSVHLTSAITNDGGISLSDSKGYHWNFNVKAIGGTGAYTQTSVVDLGLTAQPVSSTSGDFDGDGDIDVATVNQGSNTLSILLNNGTGSLTEASTPGAGTGRTAISSGDWDSDGDIDLAVVGGGGSGTAAIMMNDGSAAFTLSASPSTGMGPVAVAAADVDEDGDIDLAVALNSLNQVAIMKNNGSGTFASTSTPAVGTGPNDVVLADVDSDGDMDIATANFFGNNGSILLNDGNGTFGSLSSFATDDQPNSIARGDFDNDNDVDMAVTNRTTNTVSILRNNGSGVFTEIATPAVSNVPYAVSSLDVDGDGDLDLAVTQSSADSVSILKNNGTGTFSFFSKVAVGSQPFSLAVGDYDNDGDNDLVVNNRGSRTVSMLKNNFVPPSVTVVSPTANQNNVAQSVNITARFNQSMNTSTLTAFNALVYGSISGKHTGAVTLSGDTMLTFNPDVDFSKGEVVTVNLLRNIMNSTGDSLPYGYHWSFTVLTSGGTALFSEVSTPTVGTSPAATLIADFDNDGDADIAAPNTGSATVSILMNNGSGSFSVSSSPAVGLSPSSAASADFDADGDMDLAVANAASNTLTILANDGSGAFTETSSPEASNTPVALGTGDLDGDGDIDIIVVRQAGNSIAILKNNGAGGFALAGTAATGSAPNALTIGDIDSDGDLDVIVANSGTTTISVLKNNGAGVFTSSSTPTVGTTPYAIAGSDIDADGDFDVIVANRGSNTLSVMKNNGTGTFTQSSAPSVGDLPSSVTIGNFDSDADLDVAVADLSDNTVSIMKNGGTGTFTRTIVNAIDVGPNGISSGDLDSDGDIDLAVSKGSSASVSILKNNVSPLFAVSPSVITYGNVVLGSGLVKDSVMVTNNGDAPLSITSVTSSSVAFSVTPSDGSVSAGDSMKFYISFAPTGIAFFSGRIVFTHNATGSPDTVLVSGTGIENPDPIFSVTPSSINFGNVLVGGNTDDSVTVTNTGNTPLTLASVLSDNPKVTVTPDTATLAADASRKFYITMSPDVVETVRANIVFTHNASGSPDTVSVIGNALLTIPRYYLSLPPDSMAAKKPGKTTFLTPVPRVKKNQLYPNWANLISEVVIQGGFQANASESDSMGGMRVGISHITKSGNNKFKIIKDSGAVRGWARLTKWTFPTARSAGKGTGFAVLQTTLSDKSGKHTGVARGFDSTGVPGQTKPKRMKLVKELTSLPPGKHNNKLFGELVALKFNIAASQLAKTPEGFGELLFDTDGNPCDGLHVKEISRKADSAMTYWRNYTQEYYDSLYSAIYRINRAFVGALDTASFKSPGKLVLEGAVDVNTLSFLSYDTSITVTRLTPAMVADDELETIASDETEIPGAFALGQNYPNPFNPTTSLSFVLGHTSRVTLKVYNMLGQGVATLLSGEEMEQGSHELEFDASRLSSGVYFYKLEASRIDGSGKPFTQLKKMVLMK